MKVNNFRRTYSPIPDIACISKNKFLVGGGLLAYQCNSQPGQTRHVLRGECCPWRSAEWTQRLCYPRWHLAREVERAKQQGIQCRLDPQSLDPVLRIPIY